MMELDAIDLVASADADAHDPLGPDQLVMELGHALVDDLERIGREDCAAACRSQPMVPRHGQRERGPYAVRAAVLEGPGLLPLLPHTRI